MTNRNELERLLAAATERPWAVCTDATGDTFIASMTDSAETVCEMGAMDTGEGQAQLEADAALICFLRNNAQHYLSLMDEVERLREALDEDVLEEAISDTLDLDWQPRWAAKEIRRRAALGETHDR